MRVTSSFFVSALVRRVFAAGGFAAVEKKGAEEAGAIFVRMVKRNGSITLFAPADQASAAEASEPALGGRLFQTRLADVTGEEVAALLERERRFDPDLWIVELEIEEIGDLLSIAA